MGEKLDPYGPRRPNESRSAYMRRIFDRKPRPTSPATTQAASFWLSIVVDYVRNNPGCNQSEAARSIVPMRSEALGRKLVTFAQQKGIITIVKTSSTQGHRCYINDPQ